MPVELPVVRARRAEGELLRVDVEVERQVRARLERRPHVWQQAFMVYGREVEDTYLSPTNPALSPFKSMTQSTKKYIARVFINSGDNFPDSHFLRSLGIKNNNLI